MSNPFIIYNYNHIGVFVGSQEYDPQIGVGLPAYSTDIAPPDTGKNQVAVFSGDEWSVVPDYRGQTFYRKSDRKEIIIQDIGEVGEEFTDLAPTTIFDTWINGEWVTDTVAEEKANLLSQIKDLEKNVTQRRIREAVLGIDNGWLEDIESQISALREKL